MRPGRDATGEADVVGGGADGDGGVGGGGGDDALTGECTGSGE